MNESVQPVGPPASDRRTSGLNTRMFWGLGAALIAGMGVILLFTDFGSPAVRFSYDWTHALLPASQAGEIAVIGLDEETYRELGQSPKDLDRMLFVRLINRLAEEGAQAVAMDIYFGDTNRAPAVDAALALAMRRNGRVILVADSSSVSDPGTRNAKTTVLPPAELFHTNAARVGLNKLPLDPDLGVRRHYTGPEWIGGLAWETAFLMGVPLTKDPAMRDVPRWVRYYGATNVFAVHSFHAALSTNLVPKGTFSNKVVFVGSRYTVGYAGDQRDFFRSAHGVFTPGVEIHATAYRNLARGDWLRRLPGWLEFVLIAGAGVALALVALRCNIRQTVWVALLVECGLVIVWIAAARGAGLWFPFFIPMAVQVPLATFWSVAANGLLATLQKERLATLAREREMQIEKLTLGKRNEELKAENLAILAREREMEIEKLTLAKRNEELKAESLQASLAKYLPPGRVRQILSSPELLEPGASARELSILCSDIEIFSELTNLLEDDRVFRLLNDYYGIALECLHKSNGTVIKLIGDAIFAVWNVPFDEKEIRHELLACRAGLALHEKLQQFKWEDGWKLNTRIGLHSGLAQVGNLGSRERFDYTAVGKDVNLAFRLEGCNKYLGTNVLASGRFYDVVRREFVGRHVGNFIFKGFRNPVQVYELLGPLTPDYQEPPWCREFSNARNHFTENDFEAARDRFKQVIALRGKDGPSEFYLTEITRRIAVGMGPEEKNGFVKIDK